MSGRRQGDKRGGWFALRDAKLHELTRDEVEALLAERERQLAQEHLRWLDQWVPHEQEWMH